MKNKETCIVCSKISLMLMASLCLELFTSFCLSHQALLDSMGANGSTGPEAVAAAEKNAALLTARAGARDPSAIPSICRVSAALQYPAGEWSLVWYKWYG